MAASTFREYESKAIGLAKKGDELKALRAQIQQSHSDECIEKSSEECSTPQSLLDGEEPPSLPAMLAHADFALSPPGSSAAAGGGDAAGTEEVRQALLAGLPVLTLAADRPASRGPFSETTALGAGLALQ
eukprot:gene30530-38169_t